MAVETSPKPVYHSPNALGHGRQRRASGRKSFTTPVLPATISSPRTLCPRDEDRFNFNPNYVRKWEVPQSLWDRLPLNLQEAVVRAQQAGAAVDTGLERLEKHRPGFENSFTAQTPEVFTPLDESIPSLPSLPSLPPKLRTQSTTSSRFESVLDSPVFTPSQSSGSDSPASLSASQTMSPVSPICLTPADDNFPRKRGDRERSFSTPREPHDAYFATELSQLRTESIPRLRHCMLKVGQVWHEVKTSSNPVSVDDTNEFENWLALKKVKSDELKDNAERMSDTIGLASTGMGWTAP
ncbi:hypothetical protein K491DRAFT_604335 [Lophiostoma macrostomum CBS 122681]|uniref:Uncharacterized protein n=1 Tax=Lophiostoma macrostomum CBS 122681 TaxID=1314788 RepID=A0A6A6T2H1_9PLEO|nr:hypothetical protein K491DRAFT_604335 [Lophiostoma macrostomum CBS 122681]